MTTEAHQVIQTALIVANLCAAAERVLYYVRFRLHLYRIKNTQL